MIIATLTNHGFPRGHFKAIFVDEAGHSWEPEVISSFSSLLDVTSYNNNGILVLAGDPHQLGPIVRSSVAENGGLTVSFLERLIHTCPIYFKSGESNIYNRIVITKLIRCYRCHPVILKVPNDLFYEGDLLFAANPDVSHTFVDWVHLPKYDFPLLFFGVEGEAQRESDSPSWFNLSEIEVVLDFVKLLGIEDGKISALDIGIITPYQKQVSKLKSILKTYSTNTNNYENISVGSCEQFQGQEKRVIIVSTVRSSLDILDNDLYFNLGFVSNPKRFNVAVTRAQSLLIIIGNPHVLVRDHCWGELIHYCDINNSCQGVRVSRRDGSLLDKQLQIHQ
jgi:helicase MOV-10